MRIGERERERERERKESWKPCKSGKGSNCLEVAGVKGMGPQREEE